MTERTIASDVSMDRGDNALAVNEGRGPIIITRHGKPALDRKAGPRLSWREYVDWWARYEAGSLAEGQTAPDALKEVVKDADVYLTSMRPRACETARSAAPHASFESNPLFNEAPLPPPRIRGVRYLPKTWNILARAAWLNGHALDGENVKEARVRAREGAAYLHDRSAEGKVFLAAHGWFNRMLRPELRKLGWKCVRDGGDQYWSFRIYTYVGPRASVAEPED